MTPAEAAFARAVAERPDDGSLRLVFADFLEERGALDRARFVRDACALADLPRWAPGWVEHWQFAAAHAATVRVAPELPAGMHWHPFAFCRGFPEKLLVEDLAAFERHADAVFASAPVRAIRFDASSPAFSVARMLAVRALERVRAIKLSLGSLSVDDVVRLGHATLPRVEKVGLVFGALGPGALEAFLATPLARRLVALSLEQAGSGPELSTAFSSAHLPRLAALKLAKVGRLELAPILAACPGLSTLLLTGVPLGADGVALLVAAPQRFRVLDLGDTAPTARGVKALSAGRFDALEALFLNADRLGPSSADALAASAAFPSLAFLDVRGNQLGARGLDVLRRAPWIRGLARANFLANGGPDDAETLAWFHRNPHLR